MLYFFQSDTQGEVLTYRRDNYKIIMEKIRFEWDENKNRTNIRKHGISFQEASTAFFDPLGLIRYDPDYSKEEERYLLLGMTSSLRLLVVSYCIREAFENVRIISARRATRRECHQYNIYER